MTDVRDIIPDAEVERVHANADFGDISKRRVILDGLLRYSIGYTGGHTQLMILLEHGLLKNCKPGSYRADLSVKGKRYLRAAMSGPNMTKFLDIAEAGQ